MRRSDHVRRAMVALALLSVVTGCFGDWVRARSRARRDAPASASADSTGETLSLEPCTAYLEAVADHCDEILEGRPHERGCHSEMVRVMDLFREGDDPGHHRPPARARGEARDQTCARYLRALPQDRDDPPAPVGLGPRCAEWGRDLRERCVAPLAQMPPVLDRCGSDLLAFESTLEGIVFGRAERFEPMCRDAVEQLAEPR